MRKILDCFIMYIQMLLALTGFVAMVIIPMYATWLDAARQLVIAFGAWILCGLLDKLLSKD